MSIRYSCKHCGLPMGELQADRFSELQLGFHFLTPEERRDIISYSPNGDVEVKITCDYCREALDAHPELSLLGNPLQ